MRAVMLFLIFLALTSIWKQLDRIADGFETSLCIEAAKAKVDLGERTARACEGGRR